MFEPSDAVSYECFTFHRDTFDLALNGLRYYEAVLMGDEKAIEDYPELKQFFNGRFLEDGPAAEELRRARRVREYLEKGEERYKDSEGVTFFGIGHWLIKYLKSIMQLYVSFLRERRDQLARDPRISRAALATLDARISAAEERAGQGAFRDTTPVPLLFAPGMAIPTSELPEILAVPSKPRPEVISSIEIRDEELRRRCLDLLRKFTEEGSHDRLDTVLSDATRILEHRLRKLTNADPHMDGEDLAKHAFMGDSPRLRVSQVQSQQVAAFKLFCGIFGLIRNKVHHELVANLDPVRALQQVAMVDYLMFVAESASQSSPGERTTEKES